nr:DNA polymerase delta subunit 4 [Fagopyrum tataricum]
MTDDGFTENERILRTFDMNMVYGPCSGMTRIERWERAVRLGLNPPMDVKAFLISTDVNHQCLWYPRV